MLDFDRQSGPRTPRRMSLRRSFSRARGERRRALNILNAGDIRKLQTLEMSLSGSFWYFWILLLGLKQIQTRSIHPSSSNGWSLFPNNFCWLCWRRVNQKKRNPTCFHPSTSSSRQRLFLLHFFFALRPAVASSSAVQSAQAKAHQPASKQMKRHISTFRQDCPVCYPNKRQQKASIENKHHDQANWSYTVKREPCKTAWDPSR